MLSTIFAKYQPNIVIGGTYSGQIVLWDRRCVQQVPPRVRVRGRGR